MEHEPKQQKPYPLASGAETDPGFAARSALGTGPSRIIREFEDTFPAMHDVLEIKIRPATGGRPVREVRTGDNLHRETGKWHRKERVIDRERNKYTEVITDSETGEVVHECEEHLTQHRGHGSAKRRKA